MDYRTLSMCYSPCQPESGSNLKLYDHKIAITTLKLPSLNGLCALAGCLPQTSYTIKGKTQNFKKEHINKILDQWKDSDTMDWFSTRLHALSDMDHDQVIQNSQSLQAEAVEAVERLAQAIKTQTTALTKTVSCRAAILIKKTMKAAHRERREVTPEESKAIREQLRESADFLMKRLVGQLNGQVSNSKCCTAATKALKPTSYGTDSFIQDGVELKGKEAAAYAEEELKKFAHVEREPPTSAKSKNLRRQYILSLIHI